MELRNHISIIAQILMLSHGVQGWRSSQHCSGVVTGQHRSLTYLSGDALTDSRDCLGPGGQRYPHEEVDKFVRQQSGVRGGSSRQGRAMNLGTVDPWETQKTLLSAHKMTRDGLIRKRRDAEDDDDEPQCTIGGAPPRLCKSTYNTTAPMYGVSLTSGQPVTIVQKFPDLLQQVIYETCDSIIPLGPVTLTGQDYVLVESGCTCRPKYATPGSDPNPQDIIPKF